MDRIYLDDNGSSPASLAALDTIKASLHLIGNPSSTHGHGRLLRAELDDARHDMAAAVDARAKDLYFCSGASEANRLFCDALILKAKELGRPLLVLMSPFEHPSLYKPVEAAMKDGYFSLKIIDIDEKGRLYADKSVLSQCDALLCCQAHNESGIVPKLSELFAQVRDDAIVMSDISQGFARLDPLEGRVDVMTFSAQKMGGLAGMGGLVLQKNAKALKAPWLGGGQERGFRPGTEASLLILACAAAAREMPARRAAYASIKVLRDRFEEKLLKELKVRIIGQELARLPNTSAITFKDQDPDALRIACDLAGLSVGFGSACSGLAPEGSYSLTRMGLSLEEQKCTLRFSFPPSISAAELLEAAARMQALIAS